MKAKSKNMAPTKASTSKMPSKPNKKAVIGKVPAMKKGGSMSKKGC